MFVQGNMFKISRQGRSTWFLFGLLFLRKLVKIYLLNRDFLHFENIFSKTLKKLQGRGCFAIGSGYPNTHFFLQALSIPSVNIVLFAINLNHTSNSAFYFRNETVCFGSDIAAEIRQLIWVFIVCRLGSRQQENRRLSFQFPK